jgi:hypothetical protein
MNFKICIIHSDLNSCFYIIIIIYYKQIHNKKLIKFFFKNLKIILLNQKKSN